MKLFDKCGLLCLILLAERNVLPKPFDDCVCSKNWLEFDAKELLFKPKVFACVLMWA